MLCQFQMCRVRSLRPCAVDDAYEPCMYLCHYLPPSVQVDMVTATHLLAAHQYDVEAVLQTQASGCADNTADIAGSGPSAFGPRVLQQLESQDSACLPRGEQQQQQQAEPKRCIVCFEEPGHSHFTVSLPCAHSTCDTCWQAILRATVDDGQARALCPMPTCRLPLPMVGDTWVVTHSLV